MTWFGPSFKARFLDQQQQQNITYHWPDFDQKLGFCDQQYYNHNTINNKNNTNNNNNSRNKQSINKYLANWFGQYWTYILYFRVFGWPNISVVLITFMAQAAEESLVQKWRQPQIEEKVN